MRTQAAMNFLPNVHRIWCQFTSKIFTEFIQTDLSAYESDLPIYSLNATENSKDFANFVQQWEDYNVTTTGYRNREQQNESRRRKLARACAHARARARASEPKSVGRCTEVVHKSGSRRRGYPKISVRNDLACLLIHVRSGRTL